MERAELCQTSLSGHLVDRRKLYIGGFSFTDITQYEAVGKVMLTPVFWLIQMAECIGFSIFYPQPLIKYWNS